VLHDHDATLPGYYRATKRWDIAVVLDEELLAVMELKSIASSFGNNLNNRIEEAVGNNTDLYQAYETGLFEPSPTPWVGYLILMADTEKSRQPVRIREPSFEVDDAFKDASYTPGHEWINTQIDYFRSIRLLPPGQGTIMLSGSCPGVYIDRAEQLCLRMVRQRLVDAATFLTSGRESGLQGEYDRTKGANNDSLR